MNRLPLSVFLFLGVIQVAYGIKCYVCHNNCSTSNLENNKDKYLYECHAQRDMCLRVWTEKDGKTVSSNICATQAICDATKKRCEKAAEDGELDGGKCGIGCCDTDACNAATPVSFSLFLITVCSVYGLIFLK